MGREKLILGIKKADSATLKGCQVYRDPVRERDGPGGGAQAEEAGVAVEERGKRLTTVQNAKHLRTVNAKSD